MSKAILVLPEIPYDCRKCPCFYIYTEPNGFTSDCCSADPMDVRFLTSYDRPEWCPLKPMPEEKLLPNNSKGLMEMGYVIGWNNCLRKIGGN